METFIGDTVDIRLNTGIDTTPYTTKYIKYAKPNGTTGHWVAATDPYDSNYLVVACDKNMLTLAGTWKIQSYLGNANESLHGQRIDLIVLAPIYQS